MPSQFEIDLEFVQLLCNPSYIEKLVENNCFADENFIRYLENLQYWKEEPYIYHLIYPQCLLFLDYLLKNKGFFVDKTEVERALIDFWKN